MELQFASLELQRLYTDNVGADKYAAEIVSTFRRRIRHIEAAKDLKDLQSPGGVQYRKISVADPVKSSLALNDFWDLIISEHDHHGSKQVVVLEISKRVGGKG